MWDRKQCCICRTNFAVHPNAKKYFTRHLCIECRVALKDKPLQYRLELNRELSNKEFANKVDSNENK